MGIKRRTNKTQATTADPHQFIAGLADERRRRECQALVGMMSEISGQAPVLWGSIIGFGRYHYKYESGREGDFMRIGFAPRKQALTLYLMPGFAEQGDLLAKLGPHKSAKSCLYIKRLDDVDHDVLGEMLKRSLEQMERTYGPDTGA